MVLGDIILDQFIWGDVERISPEAPVPVVVRREEFRIGGAGSVAANIKALGGDPLMVGVINTDASGEKIQHEMERLKLTSAGLLIDLGRPTVVKTRIIAAHQQVCRVDRESPSPMSMELFRKAHRFLRACRATRRSGVGLRQGAGEPAAARPTRAPHGPAGGQDRGHRPQVPELRHLPPATILTPNLRRASSPRASGSPTTRRSRQAADAILKKTRAENLLVCPRRGHDPVPAHRLLPAIPTAAREVFDVTGAGDTVIGTLT